SFIWSLYLPDSGGRSCYLFYLSVANCMFTVCEVAREHRCGDGRCVSRDWLCDGDHDCLDKSDELNCCDQGLLECRNGQCIPSAFRCDGEDDCKDGSDEDNCTCSPSHFKCRSGRCVLASKRCDGHLDCDDHSDEDNCGESCQTCSVAGWLAHHKQIHFVSLLPSECGLRQAVGLHPHRKKRILGGRVSRRGRGPGSARCRAVRADTSAAASSSPGSGL
uniref:Uncharacterized protein n=1 Tax=Maylandia zebra TaxID=106582 RepID=A0A3P9DKF6_9CICH